MIALSISPRSHLDIHYRRIIKKSCQILDFDKTCKVTLFLSGTQNSHISKSEKVSQIYCAVKVRINKLKH